MDTVCHKQLCFGSLFGKQVTAAFDGGRISSDGGAFLLRELDDRYGVSEGAARGMEDHRHASWVLHDLKALIRQRVFSIALGYEDNNDAATLRSDPALKASSGRLSETSADLASSATLCRFENQATTKDLRRLADGLFELYLRTHPGPRDLVVLDIDATDDPTHGEQQLSFFHGYYEEHMYHPLVVFDGISGFPLACVLRPGNTHASHRAKAVLKRLVKRLKRAYPKAQILLRADAGFAVPGLYRFCERERIRYAIGLITNERLRAKVAPFLEKAETRFRGSGEKQRLFTSFTYRAESWKRYRQVVAKVEYMAKGPNQRFVVTNIHLPPQRLYDEIYVLRGETENRIKELKLELKADRLSCHRFLANQFRLFLHTFAYCLFWLLRQHLKGTELACAQVGTLRLKLLKIGARIRETSRRLWIHLASAYPYKRVFCHVLHTIREAPI
jgi:Transposase DDE domain group 1